MRRLKSGYMEKMNMHSRNEYLRALRGKYLKSKTGEEEAIMINIVIEKGLNSPGLVLTGRMTMLTSSRKTGHI